ncbi:MAG: 4Fe-4S binding protein [Candidatus Cloacimonetes bacterium]|nr:4Fe-4S binding protein [Candidatus Cloacimonadota bacterium]
MKAKLKLFPLSLREVIQSISLLSAAAFLIFIILGYKQAIHAICPYAAVCFGLGKTGFLWMVVGAFWLTAIASILILLHSAFYGRVFCGYVCPLGTFQEAIFTLRSTKYRRQHKVSFFYEQRFARLKYLIMLITMLLSIFGIGYIYIRFCPIYGISMLPKIAIPGFIVFLLIAIASFFLERFWCRYLCPYAALLNIFQWLGNMLGIKRKKIRRNLERCIDCGICVQNCPMNLNITEYEYVHSLDCIHCKICADKCPKSGTISMMKDN